MKFPNIQTDYVLVPTDTHINHNIKKKIYILRVL